MIGQNEMRLNCSSMKEAMQEWIDAHFKDKQRVTDVSWNSQFSQFVVRVESAPEASATA